MIVSSLSVTGLWITVHERVCDPYRRRCRGRPMIRSLPVDTRLQLLISTASMVIKPGSKRFAAHGSRKRNNLPERLLPPLNLSRSWKPNRITAHHLAVDAYCAEASILSFHHPPPNAVRRLALSMNCCIRALT